MESDVQSKDTKKRKKNTAIMKKYIPHLNVLLAAALWGNIGLFSRLMLRAGLSAANIVTIRIFGGFFILTLVMALADRSVFRIQARDLPCFFGMGVGSVMMNTWCYFKCQQLCSLAVSAVLLYTAPAIVVVLNALLFHEKITRRKLAALVLALLGCTFVTGVWSGGLSVTPMGLVFGLLSGLCYALYSILGPFVLKKYPPMTVVYWSFVFAGLGSLAMLDLPELTAAFAAEPRLFWIAPGMMVLCMVLPYILYTRGLSRLDGGEACILASFEPVVATFVGILVFGEPMSVSVFAGLGCILACVYILR